MIILTELDNNGKVIMDHGSPRVQNMALDNAANMLLLKDRMAVLSRDNPTVTYAIVRQAFQIIHRTGEPQHPCG